MRMNAAGRLAVLGLLVLATGASASAESPFAGKWKLNPEKSEFAGPTIAFEQTSTGDIKATAEGQTYTFKVDGKDYPAPFNQVAAWTNVDAASWQAVYKMPKTGAVVATDTLSLSADGKTLTSTSKGTMPNGEGFEVVTVYHRVSGEGGLMGRWKSAKVKVGSPTMFELATHEGDGLRWTVPAQKITFGLKLDGKDVPVDGPMIPPGFAVSATRIDDRSFELQQKVDGKVVYRGTYALSGDGKALTLTFEAEGTGEKVKAVYERQ